MNDLFEKLKKIAAAAIITLLAGMMLLMFLPGSISDATGIFKSNRYGSFDGKDIAPDDYRAAYEICAVRLESIPEKFRKTLLQNCINRTLEELFVLPSIGEELGIAVSAQSVERNLYEELSRQLDQINQTARSEDDKLTLRELYLRAIRYRPIAVRLRSSSAIAVHSTLTAQFPYPRDLILIDEAAKKITMDLRYLRYNNALLSRRLEKNVTVDPGAVRRAYEQEQKALKKEERKSFALRKPFLENRIRSESARKALTGLKNRLGQIGEKPDLDRVAGIIGIAPRGERNINLAGLRSIRERSGEPPINLALPGLLAVFADAGEGLTVGPLQDGDHTVYIEIRNIRTGKIALQEKDIHRIQHQLGGELAQQLVRYLIEKHSVRGEFKTRPVRFEQ